MNTLLILWLIGLVVIMTVYVVSNADSDTDSDDKNDDGYPAVAIDFKKSDACPAAMKFAGQRFLLNDAPILPLANCARAECGCKYRRYDDRRAGPRRGDDRSGMPTGFDGIEKRDRKRRRRVEDTLEGISVKKRYQDLEDHDPFADTYYDFIANETPERHEE